MKKIQDLRADTGAHYSPSTRFTLTFLCEGFCVHYLVDFKNDKIAVVGHYSHWFIQVILMRLKFRTTRRIGMILPL